MADSSTFPSSSGAQRPTSDCRRGVSKAVPANLNDADENVIMKGKALLFPDEREALFYPQETAPIPVQDLAATLLLTNINAPLSIAQIEDCSEKGSQELHFNVTFR